MTDAELFYLTNMTVLPLWFLMLLLPRWGVTERIITSPLSTLPAALTYAVLVLPFVPGAWADLMNPELGTIAALLSTPRGVTIAWIHFLAFDFFVARWAYLDARSRQISSWLVSPTLLMVLMFGPLGYCLYLGLRSFFPVKEEARAM